MAKIFITQYARQGRDDRGAVTAGEEPNLGVLTMAPGAGNTVTATALDVKTKFVEISSDTDCKVSFGVAPDATADATARPVWAKQPAFFAVEDYAVRKATMKVAATTTL